MNDIIWRAVKRAQIHAVKKPVGLMREDGKRPDSAPILPWARGKPLAWDVTVPDTFALCRCSRDQFSQGSRGGGRTRNYQ